MVKKPVWTTQGINLIITTALENKYTAVGIKFIANVLVQLTIQSTYGTTLLLLTMNPAATDDNNSIRLVLRLKAKFDA